MPCLASQTFKYEKLIMSKDRIEIKSILFLNKN